MGFPAFRSGADKFHHPFVFSLGDLSSFQIVPIGLVHHDGIGQFHNAFLDALQVIAGTGKNHQHKEIYHGTDCGF